MSIFRYLYKSTSTNLPGLLKGRSWDFFFSAHTDAERVHTVYSAVDAKQKEWFAFKEYKYSKNEISQTCFFADQYDESYAIINALMQHKGLECSKSICIDSTGFIRPYFAFMIYHLKRIGFKKIDILYSEPISYKEKENTKFSHGSPLEIRQIRGFEGAHNSDTSNDVLIINSGYDEYAIAAIAEHKRHAKKYQLIGFPSLRADMYQQCLLQINKAQESIGRGSVDDALDILAPANDPFITADILEKTIANIHSASPITNLYLSPLATKAQLLGVVLYYLLGDIPCPASIIFPFLSDYSRETSYGVSRAWIYCVEFP